MTQKQNNFYQKGLKSLAKKTLEDDERFLITWWSRKYNLPQNHPLLLSMTFEELAIEFFQDQYIKNKESGKEEVNDDALEADENWNGELSEETENEVQKLLKKTKKVDLSKYKKKEEEEEFEEIDEVFA